MLQLGVRYKREKEREGRDRDVSGRLLSGYAGIFDICPTVAWHYAVLPHSLADSIIYMT